MSVSPLRLPKLPVADWSAFGGDRCSPMAAVSDLPHVLLTTSGRAAIGLALELLGVGRGDRVLVPTYHCPTMVSPIVASGAAPHFYPTDPSGAARLDWLDKQDLRGVRAILAAHYFGLPRRMDALRAWCDTRGVALIEDCAHAFFGEAAGRPVGAWGDYAVASLTKFFPVPEGGCLASASRPIDLSLQPRKSLDRLRQWIDTVELGSMHDRFRPLTPLLASLFRAKRALRTGERAGSSVEDGDLTVSTPLFDTALAHCQPTPVVAWVERWSNRRRLIERRRQNYARLAQLLADASGARPLSPQLPERVVPYVFPLWVDEPDRSYQAVRAAGVPVFRWDVRWPGVPSLPQDAGQDWAHHVFQIGCHQDLSDRDIGQIAAAVRALIARPT